MSKTLYLLPLQGTKVFCNNEEVKKAIDGEDLPLALSYRIGDPDASKPSARKLTSSPTQVYIEQILAQGVSGNSYFRTIKTEPTNDPTLPNHYPGQVFRVQYDEGSNAINAVTKIVREPQKPKARKTFVDQSQVGHGRQYSTTVAALNAAGLDTSTYAEKREEQRAKRRGPERN